MDNNIGEIIKRIRTENNLSMDKFAKKIGTYQQVIHTWESGKIIPTLKTIQKIECVFGIEIQIKYKIRKKQDILTKEEFVKRLK